MSVVRSPVRSVVRSPVRSVFGGGDTQTDLQRLLALSPSLLIWPANGAGWQGTSGGTLAASGQPLGLGADLSQLGGKTLSEWLASAPELVTNGDFSGGTTGWAAYGTSLPTLSIVSGAMLITNTGTTAQRGASQAITTVVGRAYRITGALTASTGTVAARLRVGTIPNGGIENANATLAAGQSADVVFVATSTTTYVALNDQGTDASSTLTWDNISVRELPGNHLRAGTWASPSDAARGTFQNNAINFSGVDDFYSLLNAISITTNMTVVSAFKRASAGIQNCVIGNASAAEPYAGRWQADNFRLAALGASASGYGVGASTNTGSFVETVARTASTDIMRYNGTQIGTRTPPTVSGTLNAFGRRNANYNSGEISFLAVFPTELTGADLALVEQIAAGTNGATLS
jgi:hypothetical protein